MANATTKRALSTLTISGMMIAGMATTAAGSADEIETTDNGENTTVEAVAAQAAPNEWGGQDDQPDWDAIDDEEAAAPVEEVVEEPAPVEEDSFEEPVVEEAEPVVEEAPAPEPEPEFVPEPEPVVEAEPVEEIAAPEPAPAPVVEEVVVEEPAPVVEEAPVESTESEEVLPDTPPGNEWGGEDEQPDWDAIDEEEAAADDEEEVTEEVDAPVEEEDATEDDEAPVEEDEATEDDVDDVVVEDDEDVTEDDEVSDTPPGNEWGGEDEQPDWDAIDEEEAADEDDEEADENATEDDEEVADERPLHEDARVLSSVDEDIVTLTNAERVSRGLAPLLNYNPMRTGESGSIEWSAIQAEEGTISHDRDHIDAGAEANGCSFVGENVYMGSGERSAADIFSAWMNSDRHRANILNPDYRYISNGSVIADNTTYSTMRLAVDCDATEDTEEISPEEDAEVVGDNSADEDSTPDAGNYDGPARAGDSVDLLRSTDVFLSTASGEEAVGQIQPGLGYIIIELNAGNGLAAIAYAEDPDNVFYVLQADLDLPLGNGSDEDEDEDADEDTDNGNDDSTDDENGSTDDEDDSDGTTDEDDSEAGTGNGSTDEDDANVGSDSETVVTDGDDAVSPSTPATGGTSTDAGNGGSNVSAESSTDAGSGNFTSDAYVTDDEDEADWDAPVASTDAGSSNYETYSSADDANGGSTDYTATDSTDSGAGDPVAIETGYADGNTVPAGGVLALLTLMGLGGTAVAMRLRKNAATTAAKNN